MIAKRRGKRSTHKPKRRWSRTVHTDSTAPPPGLFSKDARTIARAMASTRVSPKGIGSGIRMIQFFINRAERKLLASRRRVLEHAKKLLQGRRDRERGRHPSK